MLKCDIFALTRDFFNDHLQLCVLSQNTDINKSLVELNELVAATREMLRDYLDYYKLMSQYMRGFFTIENVLAGATRFLDYSRDQATATM